MKKKEVEKYVNLQTREAFSVSVDAMLETKAQLSKRMFSKDYNDTQKSIMRRVFAMKRRQENTRSTECFGSGLVAVVKGGGMPRSSWYIPTRPQM